MDPFDISYPGAVLAGFLSFASPCILPLVPAYLCFLGGMSFAQLSGEEGIAKGAGRRLVLAALAFVLGFASVFIAMGAGASAVNRLLFAHMTWLAPLAGAIIILLGLHYMGLFRLGFLDFEKRLHLERRPAGLAGAFLIGFAFAFGWTPCVGPVLAAILLVAAGKESVGEGVALLAAYAAGLGLPFLGAALAAQPFLKFLARFRRHVRKVEIAMGGLLVATGLLIVLGKMNAMSNWLLETIPALGKVG
ncbi:MAG: cytochrome c biogenesis protein CcdA [Rhodospirillales bacterium]|nr:cytochrome c biogenesis protein CcdA [Rhodospirillales bacterium]